MKAQKSSIVCESPRPKARSMGISQEESEFMHQLFQRAKPLKERSTTKIARVNRSQSVRK